MVLALKVPYPVRVPALQAPAARRPFMRLVGGAGATWAGPLHPIVARPALPCPAPAVPSAVDEQDAERWDGMA